MFNIHSNWAGNWYKNRIKMKTKEEVPIIEPIAFMIEGDEVVVVNPCRIPLSLLKKQKPCKKGVVNSIFMIKIPINRKMLKEKLKSEIEGK